MILAHLDYSIALTCLVLCTEVWAMNGTWQGKEKTLILVFNLPPNQPGLVFNLPSTSVWSCWTRCPLWSTVWILYTMPPWLGGCCTELSLSTTKSLFPTGESWNSLIRTAHRHRNPGYHCPVTPLKSPREREECEAIPIKDQDSQHTPAIWRWNTQEKFLHPSTPDVRRLVGDIPCREPHRSVGKRLGGCNPTSLSPRLDFRGFLTDIIEGP